MLVRDAARGAGRGLPDVGQRALHKALPQAVADGLLPRNAADVKAPRPAPEEMRPLSEDEARRFLDSASEADDAFEALYVLAITTGLLRRGELLALRWEDADLERGTLRVGRSLTRERGRYLIGDTKTKKGRRRVNLTPRTVAALKAHRKRQLEERVRLVGLYEDQGLVFATRTGAIVGPENLVKRSFKPLLKRAGLPEIRFHDLRYTCATTLLGRGVHPKLAQELLGHATVAMTLDTYSHYLPSMGDQAGGATGEAFGYQLTGRVGIEVGVARAGARPRSLLPTAVLTTIDTPNRSRSG